MVKTLLENKIAERMAMAEALQREIQDLIKQKETAETKDGMEKWIDFEFESSSGLTEEFAEFASDFKKYLKEKVWGFELVAFNRGHFYLSGFFKNETTGKFAYFSTGDVRYSKNAWYSNILVRTAEHEKDYTGGSNNSVKLEGLQEKVAELTD